MAPSLTALMFAVVAMLGPSAVSGTPAPPHAPAAPAYGTYAWPVRGPVIRGFEPPSEPYGPGHRGIDIGVPFGTDVMAAQSGVVAFAGPIAGALFVSIDHADGVRTTYSWLSDVAVAEGQAVGRFQLIGKSGAGHPGSAIPHLHFGARIGRTYLDPMLLLGPGSVVGVIHLAPLADGAGGDGAWLADGMVLAGQGGKPP